MNRSKWKGPALGKKIAGKKIILKRHAEIVPSLIGKVVWVHNGVTLVRVKLKENAKIGYKIGEFVPTRGEFVFKKKRKNK